MPATVMVTIGESQIRRAKKGQCNACPHSVALYDVVKKNKLPWKAIRTTEQVIEYTDTVAGERVQIPTPPRVTTFLKMFDDGLVIDTKGNIKVREFKYGLHTDRSIRRKLMPKKPRLAKPKTGELPAEPAAVPAENKEEPAGTEPAAKVLRVNKRAHASATRRRGTRGFDQHKAFLLKNPIDGEGADDGEESAAA